ncbi:MAG TPA: 1-acyl-sn-glycerol-3-phosphate acyltransferase, partial [Bacteroidales bacterium]
LPGFFYRWLERTIHQEEMNYFLDISANKTGIAFLDEAIAYFDLHIQTIGLEHIANDRRYIFASNHPLGGLDGIVLINILSKKFGNIKAPVNDILMNIENIKEFFIPINKHGKQDRASAIETEEIYKSDKQVLTFPAGLCSRKIKGKIVDLQWKKNFITKAIQYKRDIVPVYFDGKNSDFFYNLSNLRKKIGVKANIEMLYLPDEMFKQKGKELNIYFGKPISYETFDKSKTPEQWADFVKSIVYQSKNII